MQPMGHSLPAFGLKNQVIETVPGEELSGNLHLSLSDSIMSDFLLKFIIVNKCY